MSVDITVHEEKPDDVVEDASDGSGNTTAPTGSAAQGGNAAGGMIVVNNDATLETLLSRAQRGEVTLLAQAKEDGTFILVENHQEQDSETVSADAGTMQSAVTHAAATTDSVVNDGAVQYASIGS